MIDDKLFEHITINPTSYSPLTGEKGIISLFEIKYSLFGIVKSFGAESTKKTLSEDDVCSLILEHEMRDHIKGYECKESQKPPLGIKPHSIWIEQRIEEIIQAIDRYRDSKKEVPKEWYFELAQLEIEKSKTINIEPYTIIKKSNYSN